MDQYKVDTFVLSAYDGPKKYPLTLDWFSIILTDWNGTYALVDGHVFFHPDV